jgi:protein TonB
VAALKQGIEGTVMVAAYVVGIGQPAKVELQSSSGNELLDRAALQAVAEWEFLPATQGGAGLASYLDIPVVFQII